MAGDEQPPVGAILAGGAGRRIGGAKALHALGGRPLVHWPLETMRQVLADVIVVAKPETEIPALVGVIVWREPAEPRHPLFGIVCALRAARGRAVLVCAVDLPFVSPSTLSALACFSAGAGVAVLAEGPGGALQPLLGRYEAAALPALEAAVGSGAPLRATVGGLSGVVRVPVSAQELTNVNTPEDLAAAQASVERGTEGSGAGEAG